MFSEQEKLVLSTVFYYNELDYPMTAFEVWKHLTVFERRQEDRLLDIKDIFLILESEKIKKLIEESEGFYFAKGRSKLVKCRLKRNKASSLKIKKLKKIAYLLRYIPFIRMIAVTGKLAMKSAGRDSDWDLFIVLKKGKIWTGRTLVTIFLHLIRKRRHGNKIKNRICLNYFISDECLKINNKERPFEINLFSANEYSFMLPVFGFKKYHKFQIQNSWIKDFKPNYSLSEVKNLKIVSDTNLSKLTRKCGEKILCFDFIENFLRRIEKEKIARNPNTHILGSIIEARDEMLVFLPRPQGREIYQKCQERLDEIGIS